MLNQGVLVLNRQWTAIHVCSVRRALSLLFEDMAKVVTEDYRTHDFDSWAALSAFVEEEGNKFVRTPRMRILVPEVILLTRYGRVPPRTVKFNRRNIYLRDHHTCQYCGARPPREELTIDHVIPRSRGGRSNWENVVLACQSCNARKGDRSYQDVGMRLARQPRRPHWFSMLQTTLRGPERPIWQKFVDVAYWSVELDQD